jgi:hypothetical protein
VWSFSTAVAGWSLNVISPRTLTVLSGLLSATSGVVWLLLLATRKLKLPERELEEVVPHPEFEEV